MGDVEDTRTPSYFWADFPGPSSWEGDVSSTLHAPLRKVNLRKPCFLPSQWFHHSAQFSVLFLVYLRLVGKGRDNVRQLSCLMAWSQRKFVVWYWELRPYIVFIPIGTNDNMLDLLTVQELCLPLFSFPVEFKRRITEKREQGFFYRCSALLNLSSERRMVQYFIQ